MPSIVLMPIPVMFTLVCSSFLCVALSIVTLTRGLESITCVDMGFATLFLIACRLLTQMLLAAASFGAQLVTPVTRVSTCEAAAPLPALATVVTGICDGSLGGNSTLTMGLVMLCGAFLEGVMRTWNLGVVPIL